ncbi:hypothetical protein DFR29_10380 [Tahibacter aquaticus]|uniref:DUF1641 domain-containing protein n=2 Tax=Tahibacter aquaticus TaxID=520092 RepID=A0A4R6Z4D2_9GAMM|nr:hypothetical protein DFR29_10380 [Tahibacter aquaticus]
MHWLDDTASPDNVMTQSDLDGLIQSIDALRKEIASATDLEADFKALLLDMVEALRRALSEYQIRGASGVDDALGEIMGRLLVHLKVVQENSKSPWFRRVFDAAMKVIKFGADAKDTKEVLGGFGQLLLEVVK